MACAFMLSRIGVTSWPLFLDWLLIYRTPNPPPAHSAEHKGTEGLSEVGCSVQAMCAFLHCFPVFKSPSWGQMQYVLQTVSSFDCLLSILTNSCL